ncbi:mucin-5AC [Eurytemora carolleeae]|uniref:mucin-5AC n=1 Tax=Eurytemora carolleeae TaxID=1294199 RepID=UPI000C774DAA|nr:mucin-5AC [Eurytemora carolleeae]|eukprot:XP_023321505.1 mucin-5AC-like [Eurytemora affinis]
MTTCSKNGIVNGSQRSSIVGITNEQEFDQDAGQRLEEIFDKKLDFDTSEKLVIDKAKNKNFDTSTEPFNAYTSALSSGQAPNRATLESSSEITGIESDKITWETLGGQTLQMSNKPMPTASSKVSLETPTSVTLETSLGPSLETPTSVTLEIPREPSLETPTSITLETSRGPSLETSTSVTVETSRGPSLETPTSVTLEIPRGPSLETPTSITLEIPRGPSLETPTSITLEIPRGPSLETPTSVTVETSRGPTLETPTSVTLETPSGPTCEQSMEENYVGIKLETSSGKHSVQGPTRKLGTVNEQHFMTSVCKQLTTTKEDLIKTFDADATFKPIAVLGIGEQINSSYDIVDLDELDEDEIRSEDQYCESEEDEEYNYPMGLRLGPIGQDREDEDKEGWNYEKDDGRKPLNYEDEDAEKVREKMKRMEAEQEELSGSLQALTSHFARLQLRLQQVTAAPEEQREELLNDLLKFSNLGIPDFRAAYSQGSHGFSQRMSANLVQQFAAQL